jgi:hypothetical protein
MAPTVVVRYRTAPDRADENARLIAEVFAELAERDTPGLRDTALRLDDGESFVHVAVVEGEDNPLLSSPAFAAFQSGLGDRVVEGPTVSPATVMGTHGGAIGG